MRLYGLVEGRSLYLSFKHNWIYTVEHTADPVHQLMNQNTDLKPDLQLGGGVLFPLNEELSLDANLRYHWINDSEYSMYEQLMAQISAKVRLSQSVLE